MKDSGGGGGSIDGTVTKGAKTGESCTWFTQTERPKNFTKKLVISFETYGYGIQGQEKAQEDPSQLREDQHPGREK